MNLCCLVHSTVADSEAKPMLVTTIDVLAKISMIKLNPSLCIFQQLA